MGIEQEKVLRQALRKQCCEAPYDCRKCSWDGDCGRLQYEPTTDRPAIVCLCGSTRFMDAYVEATKMETLAGKIVVSVGLNLRTDTLPDGADEDTTKAMLDELHKRKIDLADEVLFLNVGGYIGSSTRGELEYAIAHPDGKVVRFLHPELATEEDLARAGADAAG